MQHDTEKIKRENDIVSTIGQFIELKRDGSGHKGCCPFHSERTPSFNVNPALQTYKCFGCDAGGDVIEFIKEYKKISFTEACEYLGSDAIKSEIVKTPPKIKKEKKPAIYESLLYNAAKDHYTTDVLQGFVDKMTPEGQEPKQYKKAWSYKDLNEDGEIVVELVAARFEDEAGKKAVLSFYHNTHTIVMKNYPVLLFNRDRLKAEPEKDVLIVFGEKCAEVADKSGFIGVTWNGGEKKVNDVDFSPLMGRTCWVWGDDDQKVHPNGASKGQLLPQHKQPGTITIEAVKKHVPHVQVVEMPEFLREIEPDGADIADAVTYFDEDYAAITAYIYENSKRQEKPKTKEIVTTAAAVEPEKKSTDYPFKVLGVADDGKAYFIGLNDRLRAFDTTSLSKNKLMNLANLDWWWDNYGKSKDDFDLAVSDLIYISTTVDFDSRRLRGRGAWRENDGRICYHDGMVTTGDFSKDAIYLRLPRKDIGISDTMATREQRRAVFNICNDLTFKTMADCARTLGWAAISAFAGALKWRPCLFITAGSGTGKSTILELVINAISDAEEFTGIDTTAAGMRQYIGSDSCAVTIDEAEAKDKKSRENRTEIFGIIRQSTSNNAPKAVKGTQDGKGVKYEMKSMFCLNAINPIIDGEADEKRTSRISLVPATEDRKAWLQKEKKLKEIISPKICRSIRAYTWQNLENIFELTERVSEVAQSVTNIDNRTAYADSLLLAAFIVVFNDQPNPTYEYLDGIIRQLYEGHETAEKRNEPEEMVDRILDEVIQIDRDKFTIRDVLTSIINGKITTEDDDDTTIYFDRAKFRREVGNHGVGLDPDNNLAITKNNYKIQQMLDQGRGYHMQLERHPGYISKGKYVGLGKDAGTRNCVIIEGVL